MDQRLLKALNNIGSALEELVDAINSKSEAKTATGSAIQSGNFGEDLKSISEGIKSIKADTQTIIKNQQTIIAQGKEKESAKTKDIETDPKKESDIKKGVGTILLIAVAVLAIGMAFKLVGDVNILSVIGLALGITLIAIAFEKVAQLKLSLKESFDVSLSLVMMAGALTVSSWIMSFIKPIGPTQFLTAIFIAGTFAALSIYLDKIFIATATFSKLRVSKIALLLTLTSIAAAITASSWIMGFIKPIGIAQGITAILIASVFAAIGFNLHKIGVAVSMFDKLKVNPKALVKTLVAISAAIVASSWILQLIAPLSFPQSMTAILISALFLIISFNMQKIAIGVVAFTKTGVKVTDLLMVMVGIAAAITASSFILSFIVPIGIWQFVTALGITILFAIMSYILPELATGVVIVGKILGTKNVWMIPATMVAISLAIMLSSHILAKTEVIPFMTLLNILTLGIVAALITLALVPSLILLGKQDIKTLAKGGLGILIIATAIMLSSWILSVGKYDGDYPTTDWIKGVSLSLLIFGGATIGLGLLISASGGLGLPALALGAAGVLIVGGTIAATSHLLKLGDYKTSYPGLDWAKGVSLSLVAFGSGMVLLGGIIFASFGLGGLMLAAGALAVLGVAKTIVAASDILANGYTDENGVVMKPTYKGGPTKEWAEGISIALGAFSPVYGILMKNSGWFKSGVSPEDFSKAIKTVSQGIVSAANFFASPENPGVWAGHPTKEWAEGVGLAIGAFAPVYEILAANSGWFSKKIKPEDFAGEFDDSGKLIKPGAIQVIARGIISAAKFFADNTAPFDEGMYPSKNWGEGVGAALGAFSPVFEALQNKGWFKSDKKVVDGMVNGIISISTAIVRVAKMFSFYSKDSNIFENYPDTKWSNNIRTTIEKFVDLSNYLEKNKKAPYWRANSVANRIVSMAKILHGGSEFFSNTVDPNYISSVSQNMLDFNELVKKLTESESEGMLSRLGNNLLGTDPIIQIAKRMVTLADGYDKLAESLIKLGGAMKVLNISDIRMLGGFTSEMSKKDVDKKESTSLFNFSRSNESPNVRSDISFDKENESSLKEDVEKIIKLLTNIDKSTESSSSTLNDVLLSLSEDGITIKSVET